MMDLMGCAREVCPSWGPKIIHLHAVFGKQRCQHTHFGSWRPQENPGSATDQYVYGARDGYRISGGGTNPKVFSKTLRYGSEKIKERTEGNWWKRTRNLSFVILKRNQQLEILLLI